MKQAKFVVLGGSGFLGTAVSEKLLGMGHAVTSVDQRPPPDRVMDAGGRWLGVDLLTAEELPDLPGGTVVVLAGSGDPRPRWPWTLALHNAVLTARILPLLTERQVVLASSVEVYGSAPAPLREDSRPELPWTPAEIDDWCAAVRRLAADPCPPWRAAPLCRELAAADPTGRWTYALSKLAQERLIAGAVVADRLTVLRLANIVGLGQERVVTRLVRRALADLPLRVTSGAWRSFLPTDAVGDLLAGGVGAGVFNVGGEAVEMVALARQIRELCGSASVLQLQPRQLPDSCGVVDTTRLAAAGYRVGPMRPYLERMVRSVRHDTRPLFHPPLPVVVPPRPAVPDEVVERQQHCLWSGAIKHGNRWTRDLTERLAKEFGLDDEHKVLATASGTAALRVMVAAAVGPARPGDVAALPSFTFPATAEVLVQLGYRLRFVDVDERTWTLDARALAGVLAHERVRLVMCVDTFGNPCDYDTLRRVCGDAGVPLLADSAAALGSLYQGRPVATQALGHAYSMSFAKVLSAGGAGGALVLPGDAVDAVLDDPAGWTRSALMNELHGVVALDQLAVLDDLVRRREQVAAVYQEAVPSLPGVVAQQVRAGDRHSYVHWVLRVPRPPGRGVVEAALMRLGVGTKPYFRALHLGRLGDGRRLPVTERLDAEALALPMSSEIGVEEAERVVIALRRCLAGDAP